MNESSLALLHTLVTQRFDSLDMRVDALTEQVKETNGRVREHDRLLAAHDLLADVAKTELGRQASNVHELRGKLQDLTLKIVASGLDATGETRRLTQRDAVLFVAGLGAMWGVLKALAAIWQVLPHG